MNLASGSTHIADAKPVNWVERHLPMVVLPYAQLMRLDRPIGWWLLLLPCWWALVLGQIANGGGLPNLWHAALFLIGAIVMRGAGCTLNDLADQKFDAMVERTKNRPLASGRISRKQAFLFLMALSFIGLIVLLQFNWYSNILGASSLLIVAIYPFMKRITHWPQFVLGLAFNWGALIGWTATHGALAPAAVLLYAGGILWTLAYDTIYAHQDKEDDVLIGVKSTALLFGAKTRPWLSGFFASAITLMALALWRAQAGPASYIGLAAAALHAAWQTITFDHTNSNQCLKLFKSNRTFGLLFLAGLLVDTLIR
jgi:4-hydroxybenzoate polyprenyltransferase